MRLQLCSDLHGEFMQSVDLQRCFVRELAKGNRPKDTILVVAGDISTGIGIVPWLEAMCGTYHHVVAVFGNHDFYRSNICEFPNRVAEATIGLTNLTILDNSFDVVDDVMFMGGTLWSDCWGCAHLYASVSDYMAIEGANGSPIRTQDTLMLHDETVGFLYRAMRKMPQMKRVVVTHHMPSYRMVAPGFANSELNPFFASHLDSMIELGKPDIWVCGHTHTSARTRIGSTELYCNPYGYNGDNKSFDYSLVVEI